MGASHQNNYNKSLVFVQQLTDNNFGQVQIFRNQDGKFVMKNQISFITGDKRYEDFKKIMQFVRKTQNKNILSVMYLQHEHESHVCIQYEKFYVYTEYLNFTLKELIVNKKNVQQQEIWYCLKAMIQLIIQLQKNNLKVIFSLDNIFLTLKGIPSLYLYHMICQDKSDKVQQQHTADQMTYKIDSMYSNLGKSIIQLANTQLISSHQQSNFKDILNDQIVQINKKNEILGQFLRQLIGCSDGMKLLNKIQTLVQNKKIRTSTQIRFNKFRYVVSEQDKPKSALNDLKLNEDGISNFRQPSLSVVNTPIYRLRQNAASQNGQRNVGIKDKLLMTEHNFFKNKRIVGSISKSRRQSDSLVVKQKSQRHELSKSKLKLRITKQAYSQSSTQNPHQNSKNQQRHIPKNNQKLSLISKKLSARTNNKIQKSLNYLNNQQPQQNESQQMDQQSNKSLKDKQNQKINYKQNQNNNVSQSRNSVAMKIRTNNIRDVLNAEIVNNEVVSRNHRCGLIYNMNVSMKQKGLGTQSGLAVNRTWAKQNAKLNIQQSEGENTKIPNQQQATPKTQQHRIPRKNTPPNSRLQQVFQTKKISTQHINNTTQHSEQSQANKIYRLEQSINPLDKANFLSMLQVKKYQNDVKNKYLSEKKEFILCNAGGKIKQVMDKQQCMDCNLQLSAQDIQKENVRQAHLNKKMQSQDLSLRNYRNPSLQLHSKQQNSKTINNKNSKFFQATANQQNENKQNTLRNNCQKNENNQEINKNKFRTMSVSEKGLINQKNNKR